MSLILNHILSTILKTKVWRSVWRICMWILGLKGLIWKRLFRGLDKVSLLLKINLLIKLVLWSFFGPKKGWQITWAPPQGRG